VGKEADWMRGRWLIHNIFNHRPVYPTTMFTLPQIWWFSEFQPHLNTNVFVFSLFIISPVYDQTCMNQLQTRLLEGHTQTQGSGVMFALQKTLMDMTISHPVSIHCLGNKIQSIPQERAVATYNFLFGSLKHSSRQVIGSPQVKLIHRGGCCKSFTFHLHTTGFETRTIWRSQDGLYQCWADILIGYHLGYHISILVNIKNCAYSWSYHYFLRS